MYLKFVLTCLWMNTLSAASITGASLEEIPRYLYQLINGTSYNSYSGNYSGPTNSGGQPIGLLGLLRDETGVSGIYTGLQNCGYQKCSELPAAGTCNYTHDGESYVITFATPAVTIPANYTGGDGTEKFNVRLEVAVNGTNFMIFEYNCFSSVGFVRFAEPSGIAGGSIANTRNFEMYYDTASSKSIKMELAYYYNHVGGDDEYYQAQFSTNNSSDIFTLYTSWAREVSGVQSGYRVAMYGNKNSKEVTTFLAQESGSYTNTATTYTDNGDTAVAAGGDIMCLDYANPADITGELSSCSGYALGSPASLLINSAGDLSINSTQSDVPGALTAL